MQEMPINVIIPERLDQEPSLWYDRFLVYIQMGPTRTLLGSVHLDEAKKGLDRRASNPAGNWREAFKKWKWKERAEAYDDQRRKTVFTQGYASDLVRVSKMNALAQALEYRITKMFVNMPDPEKDKAKFNSFMYEAYLKTLDGLAAETGGRVKKQEVTGAHGTPLEVFLFLPEPEKDIPAQPSSDSEEDDEQWP